MNNIHYRRVLLKFSGELLAGGKKQGIMRDILLEILQHIKRLQYLGVEVALVVGGGNLFRGGDLIKTGMEKNSADHIGMLATVMNGIAIADTLNRNNIPAIVMSAFRIDNGICIPLNYQRAKTALADKTVVIFSAGTGSPCFTTDSAAALRGIEIDADILLKATKVDGVYDADPAHNPKAKRFDKLTFDEAIARNLKVMDVSAFTLCRAHGLKICVFNLLSKKDILVHIVKGDKQCGTIIY